MLKQAADTLRALPWKCDRPCGPAFGQYLVD